MNSSGNDRPERMYRRDRTVDPTFDPHELLYRRCTWEEVYDGYLAPTSIHFKGYSVNRSKYSEPEDVIFGYPESGIACFSVADVPSGLSREVGTPYEFRVEHLPEDNNYAHSELRAYKNGKFDKRLRLSEENKKKLKELKEAMSRKPRLLRPPLA